MNRSILLFAAGGIALVWTVRRRRLPRSENACSSVIFLGTGTSSSNPHFDCVLGLAPHHGVKGGCAVCKRAMELGPGADKNWRGNPSLLICYRQPGQDTRYIQIDAGKTFLSNARRIFPQFGIPRLDAVVLTHEHADATFGLDDLRLFQVRDRAMDIFLSWDTFLFCRKSFSYLTRRNPIPAFVGGGKQYQKECLKEIGHVEKAPEIATFVASLRWNVIAKPSLQEAFEPFTAAGLEIIQFPVLHGENYFSLGFALGKGKSKFVYISDVSEIPDQVMHTLRQWDIQHLVIDTLHPTRKYPTHMNLTQSLTVIEDLAPKKTLLVGVSHMFDHDVANAELALLKAAKGLDVQIAFDGQEVDLPHLDL